MESYLIQGVPTITFFFIKSHKKVYIQGWNFINNIIFWDFSKIFQKFFGKTSYLSESQALLSFHRMLHLLPKQGPEWADSCTKYLRIKIQTKRYCVIW